jgi:hypothetical protein
MKSRAGVPELTFDRDLGMERIGTLRERFGDGFMAAREWRESSDTILVIWIPSGREGQNPMDSLAVILKRICPFF